MEYYFDMNYDLTNKAVIVSGAARGIGRCMVGAFIDQGARVLAADRDAEGLAETGALFPRAASLVEDVSTPAGAEKIVAAAIERFGRLDICVNNAAVAPHTALLDETMDVWDKVYAVNCRGTFLMTQAAGKAMIAGGGGGRIINFSSGASLRGGPGAAAYASSRAATESFTRVAAIELAPHNILVNAVSPGLIDTQPKPLPPEMARSLQARIPGMPLARAGRPEEVASVVLFLASDASSFITGTTIHVDGGSSIGSRFTGPVVDDDPRYDWVTGRDRSN